MVHICHGSNKGYTQMAIRAHFVPPVACLQSMHGDAIMRSAREDYKNAEQ
jgi:hypothetical protein